MNLGHPIESIGRMTGRVFQHVPHHGASARFRWARLAVMLLVAALVVAPTGALAASNTHGRGWTSTRYDSSKSIEINLSSQWLTAYEGDTPVFGTAVSTGVDGYDTPAGEFAIEWMLEWETMAGEDYYLEDVPYVMYFADYLAIHGAYWHDNFGEPMSHGCVNLPVWAAEWLYDWASIGTPVWIHY
jgi:lipoprotein-anchoring transpeptidase ErfK/SrfK